MNRTHLSSAYQKSRSYSPAVITQGGRIVWLAGHLAAEDESGRSLAGDFDGQVRCVFRKLDTTLREAGKIYALRVPQTLSSVAWSAEEMSSAGDEKHIMKRHIWRHYVIEN